MKIILPPYSGLGVYGGIITGTIAAWWYARRRQRLVPALGRHRRARPVRHAGDRPLGELLQPGAVRPADDAAVGHPDRLRPSPAGRLRRARLLPERPRASIRCSCTSRSRGCSARSFLIWLGFALPIAAAAGRPAADLLHLVRGDAVRCSRTCARTTGRSSASRRRRSCRWRSSPSAWSALIRHRAAPPADRPPAYPAGRDVGCARGDVDDPTEQRVVGERAAAGDRWRPMPTPTTPRSTPMRRRPTRDAGAGRDAPTADDARSAARRRPEVRPTPMTEPAARRRRPPPGRISPEALAAARGGAVEGLAWLGRAPEAKASLLYRSIRLLVRFLLLRACSASGSRRPGRSTSRRRRLPARRRGPSRLDGPVRRDARAACRAARVVPRQRAVDLHLPLARVAARPSVGCCPSGAAASASTRMSRRRRPSSPTAPSSSRCRRERSAGRPAGSGPMRNGWAIIAMRTGAPILPLAMAGTEELYIGRRMASRVLPPTSSRELAALPSDASLPEPGSREELDARPRPQRRARRATRAGRRGALSATVDPPDQPRRLRDRLTWLLLRPGRLDRD